MVSTRTWPNFFTSDSDLLRTVLVWLLLEVWAGEHVFNLLLLWLVLGHARVRHCLVEILFVRNFDRTCPVEELLCLGLEMLCLMKSSRWLCFCLLTYLHSSSVDATLSTPWVDATLVHVVTTAVRSIRKYLVIKECHVTLLILSWPVSTRLSIHWWRIEHKVLSLWKHLVSCKHTFTDIVSLGVSDGLVTRDVAHELATRARTFISLVGFTFRLIAHASISQSIASFFWTYSLQLVAKLLSSV